MIDGLIGATWLIVIMDEQTGYPLGLKVKSTAHSYGVSFAEDIMFVTQWVYNQKR